MARLGFVSRRPQSIIRYETWVEGCVTDDSVDEVSEGSEEDSLPGEGREEVQGSCVFRRKTQFADTLFGTGQVRGMADPGDMHGKLKRLKKLIRSRRENETEGHTIFNNISYILNALEADNQATENRLHADADDLLDNRADFDSIPVTMRKSKHDLPRPEDNEDQLSDSSDERQEQQFIEDERDALAMPVADLIYLIKAMRIQLTMDPSLTRPTAQTKGLSDKASLKQEVRSLRSRLNEFIGINQIMEDALLATHNLAVRVSLWITKKLEVMRKAEEHRRANREQMERRIKELEMHLEEEVSKNAAAMKSFNDQENKIIEGYKNELLELKNQHSAERDNCKHAVAQTGYLQARIDSVNALLEAATREVAEAKEAAEAAQKERHNEEPDEQVVACLPTVTSERGVQTDMLKNDVVKEVVHVVERPRPVRRRIRNICHVYEKHLMEWEERLSWAYYEQGGLGTHQAFIEINARIAEEVGPQHQSLEEQVENTMDPKGLLMESIHVGWQGIMNFGSSFHASLRDTNIYFKDNTSDFHDAAPWRCLKNLFQQQLEDVAIGLRLSQVQILNSFVKLCKNTDSQQEAPCSTQPDVVDVACCTDYVPEAVVEVPAVSLAKEVRSLGVQTAAPKEEKVRLGFPSDDQELARRLMNAVVLLQEEMAAFFQFSPPTADKKSATSDMLKYSMRCILWCGDLLRSIPSEGDSLKDSSKKLFRSIAQKVTSKQFTPVEDAFLRRMKALSAKKKERQDELISEVQAEREEKYRSKVVIDPELLAEEAAVVRRVEKYDTNDVTEDEGKGRPTEVDYVGDLHKLLVSRNPGSTVTTAEVVSSMLSKASVDAVVNNLRRNKKGVSSKLPSLNKKRR